MKDTSYEFQIKRETVEGVMDMIIYAMVTAVCLLGWMV